MRLQAPLLARMRAAITKAAVQALGVRDLFGNPRDWSPGAWQRGLQLEPIGALTAFGAVWACNTRIANDIGKLEPLLLQRQSDGTWQRAPDASPYWRPLRKPNNFQNRVQFLVLWVTFKLLFGNVYALKLRDERTMVRSLFILDPRRVTPMVTAQGDVYYSCSGDDLARLPGGGILPASEIIHDRGNTLWHPLIGVSPIVACATSATMGLRMQTNSGKFFENMSRPSGMLTAPGTIDDVTAARLKSEWEKNYAGENLGRMAVLGDGLTYAAMTIPANDAQLIEQLAWTVEDVARSHGVPLYKIGAGPMPTAGNVEALEVQYYTGCLQILIEAFEACMGEGLGLPSDYKVQLDLDGLLRMDAKTQVDMLAAAVKGTIMAPNEARAARNLPPMAGGNALYMQQQNYSLAALAKRDERDDPFAAGKPPAPAPAPSPALPPPDSSSADDAAAAAADAAAKAIAAAQASDAVALQLRELTGRFEALERAAMTTRTAAPEDLDGGEDVDAMVRRFMQALDVEAAVDG